jgi:hypothetical protein
LAKKRERGKRGIRRKARKSRKRAKVNLTKILLRSIFLIYLMGKLDFKKFFLWFYLLGFIRFLCFKY